MYNIISAGIDHNMANIAMREKFSLTKSKQVEFYEFLKNYPKILGSTLICTCNRIEVYLSLEDGFYIDPFELLIQFLGIEKSCDVTYKIYRGTDVLSHLCMLACGGKSQIFGEDQIITQIKMAIILSRKCDMTDAVMEVLFRTGITCGKKIKTQLNLSKRETSVADFVIEKMGVQKERISRVLVIGNGEMGRHMAEKLIENGYEVVMSVRQYAHSKVVVPSGCVGIDFLEIYPQMESVDAIVSATLSPHYTVRHERFSQLKKPPKYLFDLAVPRDIDLEIANISGISIFDVDMLSQNKLNKNHEELIVQMYEIIEKYIKDFEKWNTFKEQNIIFK